MNLSNFTSESSRMLHLRIESKSTLCLLATKIACSSERLSEYITTELKKDQDIADIVVEQGKDKLTFKKATLKNCFKYVSDRLKDNKDVVIILVKIDSNCFKYASDRLKDEKNIVLSLIENKFSKSNSQMYLKEYIDLDFDNLIKKTIENQLLTLEYLSSRLKEDREITMLALEYDAFNNIGFISEKSRKDKSLLIKFIDYDPFNHNLSINHENEVFKLFDSFIDNDIYISTFESFEFKRKDLIKSIQFITESEIKRIKVKKRNIFLVFILIVLMVFLYIFIINNDIILL